MFPTISTTQVINPFGSGYVPMQHSEQANWNLARADVNSMVTALRSTIFSEVLRSLRAALSLR